MDFNIDLGLVQSQKVVLTPQLKQALEILEMNSQDLFEYVEEELETNPVLEIDDGEEYQEADDKLFYSENKDRERKVLYDVGTSDLQDVNEEELLPFTFDKSTVRLSLKEHLLFQLHIRDLDDLKNAIGEYLIDNIDENGYLSVEPGEAAAFFNIPASKVKKVMELLQSFDPVGICARNLKECLLLQLKSLNHTDDDVCKIVENYLDDLAANKVGSVVKKTGLTLQRVAEIFNYIKTLEPKPGRTFYDNNEIKFMIPDIIIKKIRNKFEVLINEDSIPLLCINRYYRKIISEELNHESRKFIMNKIDNASWLIRCIELRKVTLRNIAQVIVNNQSEFFEKGKSHIKPLNMKQMAKEINMHESAIGKAINGKYLQCTWGIFEIRYFFTGKNSVKDGFKLSDRVKTKMKGLIEAEDKRNPLSDLEITQELNKLGYKISCSTVSKYRRNMGIINSVSRKKK